MKCRLLQQQQSGQVRQHGFTLIELTIALTITGIIMAGLFGAMKQNGEVRNARMSATFDTLLLGMARSTASTAITCPANPTLKQGDANYGQPNVDGTGACPARQSFFYNRR